MWLGFCAVFLLGLVDWRRPLSVRTLDLAVLLSFSVSLWFFNRGDVFTSMPLVYPAFGYLLARMLWIGLRGRSPGRRAAFWPVWLLAAAAVFLACFRIGLNLDSSNVIDVGYSGVVGAQVAVEPIAAQQKLIPQHDVRFDQIHLHVLAVADGTGNDVALFAGARVLGTDEPLAELPVDEGMVLRQLFGLAASDPVDPAVTHLGQHGAPGREQHRRKGRAHASLVPIQLSHPVHHVRGGLYRGFQHPGVIDAAARLAGVP
jgi:hypothetical protein